MTTSDLIAALPPDLADEEALRAQIYALVSRLLARPPGAEDLAALAALQGDASPFGAAVAALAEAAGAEPEAVRRDYGDLFIGLGRGELVPYASYYLTGFLNEKPLARLRSDLARLGVARAPEVSEPEDHIAALMEVMAGLIEGRFGQGGDLAAQKRFFDAHIAPWAPYFFRDLEATKTSAFYAAVGTVGRVFLEIEETAFTMT